jgi:hypothetical protein
MEKRRRFLATELFHFVYRPIAQLAKGVNVNIEPFKEER